MQNNKITIPQIKTDQNKVKLKEKQQYSNILNLNCYL